MSRLATILRWPLTLSAIVLGGWLAWSSFGTKDASAAPPPCLIEGNCTSLTVAYDTPVPTADGFTINVTHANEGGFSLYACVARTCPNSPGNNVMWIPMTTSAATCGGCVLNARLSGLPTGQSYPSFRIMATKGTQQWSDSFGQLALLPDILPVTSNTSNPLPDGITVNWQTAFNSTSRVTYSLNAPNWYAETIPLPGGDFIQSMDALPSGVAYAVSVQGNIYRRSTAGTWTLQRNAGNRLNAVKAASDTHAWAVGQSGVIFRTTDGITWTAAPVPGISLSWRGIDVASHSTAWVVGQNQAVYFYNGSVWTNRTPPTAASGKSLNYVRSMDNNEVWTGGSDGVVFHSTNQQFASPTWTSSTLPNIDPNNISDHVYALATFDGNNIYLGGDWGKIWRSTNRGISWQYIAITDGLSGIVTLTMPNPNDLWISQVDALSKYRVGDSATTYVATPFPTSIYQTDFVNGAQQMLLGEGSISTFKVVGTADQDLTPVKNHAFALTGLPQETEPFYYMAESFAAGLSAGILGSFSLAPPDTVPPTITLTNPASGSALTRNSTFLVQGTVRDNLRISSVTGNNLTNPGGIPVTVTPPTPIVGTDVSGTWQANAPLTGPDGLYRSSYTVSDGNVANNQQVIAAITKDTTPPVLNVTAPNLVGGQVIGLPIQVAGTTSDANGIDHLDYQLNGAGPITIPAPASGTDTWSASFNNPLSGTNTLVVHSFDRAGNVTTVSGTFEYLEPTFSLSVNPSAPVTADIGQNLTYTLTVNPQNGFNSPVDFTANNPSGLTTNFAPPTATSPYPAVTATVNTSAGSPGGPYSFIITGRSGAKTASVTVQITLRTPPNFTLSASPNVPLPNLVAGNNGSYSVTVSANTTFSGVVSFSVTGQPIGVTTSITPSTTVTLAPGQTSSITLVEVATQATAPPGTYTMVLNADSGAIRKTVNLILILTAPPDIDVTFAPPSQDVTGGGVATFYNGTISSLNGFDGVVNLTATAPNPDIQLTSLAPQVAVRPGFPANVILNARALNQVATGTYVITITASGGPFPNHVVTVNLVVNEDDAPPVISNISATPNWDRVQISWETDERTSGQLTILSADGSSTIGGLPSAACTAVPCLHSLTFGGLAPLTTYRFTITAVDLSPRANQTTATTFADGSPLQFTTLDQPDSIIPTVTVDNPAASATPTTIIGSLPISGSASDNKFVSRVEAKIRDSANVERFAGNVPCSTPVCSFTINWITDQTYPNGLYTITVIATDSSGNNSNPVVRTVSLNNDFTNPLLISGPDVEVATTCSSGDCYAKITWVTQTQNGEGTTTEVRFGQSVSCSGGNCTYPQGPVYDDKSGGDPSKLYTIHEVTLTGLEPNKIYHYQILSCNRNGKCVS